jgi:hypothetical protein
MHNLQPQRLVDLRDLDQSGIDQALADSASPHDGAILSEAAQAMVTSSDR